ncbi:protein-glutamine glutaminase family protein [Acidisphaera sp. S103]|uniref:protein-glutamine glutaminase family protein n=1 Tax=Acidisphaera sp. S103 TaxID=1747223 RepID=UPI00352C2F4A
MYPWDFHVAPGMLVGRGTDCVRLEIFDPSLMDGPCTMTEWFTAMSGQDAYGFWTEREVYWTSVRRGISWGMRRPDEADIICKRSASLAARKSQATEAGGGSGDSSERAADA